MAPSCLGPLSALHSQEFSRSLSGIEGDGIFTAGAGAILLLVSLLARGKPGSAYSLFAVIVAILSGGLLLLKLSTLASLESTEGVSTSIGAGLSCVSPLAVLLAVIGGAMKVPGGIAAAVAPLGAPAGTELGDTHPNQPIPPV